MQHCHKPCQQEQLILIQHSNRTGLGENTQYCIYNCKQYRDVERKLGRRGHLNDTSWAISTASNPDNRKRDTMCSPELGNQSDLTALWKLQSCIAMVPYQLLLHCKAAQPQDHTGQLCVARNNRCGRRCCNARQKRAVRQDYLRIGYKKQTK